MKRILIGVLSIITISCSTPHHIHKSKLNKPIKTLEKAMDFLEKDYQASRINDNLALFYFTLIEITVEDLKKLKENN